ncbi:polar growth protein [Borealophlyctis nickersoniae]|nr:polar growth protein [Borealophlyctis nickersoniae]
MLGNGENQTVPFLVYGKHNFVAEEEDEISFKAGEGVVVLEKDDLYSDGWWRVESQGTNVRGDVGLFPMNFITFENISDFDVNTAEHLAAALRNTHLDDRPNPPESATYQNGQSDPITPGANGHGPHPETWTVNEVAAWLEQAGFQTAIPSFVDQEITGDLLVDLNLSSLRELGVESLGDRINILHAILALKEEYANVPKERNVPQNTGLEESSRAASDAVEKKSQVPSQDSGFAEDVNEESAEVTPRNMSDERKEERLHKTVSYFTLSDYLEDYDDEGGQGGVPETIQEEPAEVSPNAHYRSSGSSASSDDTPLSSPMSGADGAHTTHKKGLKGLARSFSHRKPRDSKETKLQEDADLDLRAADYEGWLHVKVGHKQSKKRWCVLKDGVLYILKSQEHQGRNVRAVIPLGSDYQILPDTDFTSKSKFCFMAKHAENKTFHFAAETQLAMVSWINVMVRAGQQTVRAGPIPLIPIKNNDRLSRIPVSDISSPGPSGPGHSIAHMGPHAPTPPQRLSRGTASLIAPTSISSNSGRNFPPAKYFPQRNPVSVGAAVERASLTGESGGRR